MRRLPLFVTVLFLCTWLVPGQSISRETEKTDKRYKEVVREVGRLETDADYAETSELAVNELRVNSRNKIWPAVGTYEVRYRFYYKSFGEEPYPNSLVYAVKETTSAARKYREEFLFDDSGSLILAKWSFNAPAKIKSERVILGAKSDFYFSGEKMVKQIGLTKTDNSEVPSSIEIKNSATSLVKLLSLSLN